MTPRTRRRRSIASVPEVGGATSDAGLGACRGALEDQPAEVEHVDVVRTRSSPAPCRARRAGSPTPWSATRPQDRAEGLGLGVVQPGGRLVEQEQAKDRPAAPGQLDQPALTGGQRAGRRSARASMPHSVERRRRSPRRSRAAVPRVGTADGPGTRLAGQAGLAPEGDVLPHRERVEQLHALERAAQAELGPAWRRRSPVTSRAVEAAPRPVRGWISPVQALNVVVLPGAVRADQAGDPARRRRGG